MLLCRIALAFAATAVLAQQNSGTLPDGTVDLNAPILQQHASDARHETGALKEDIVQSLQNATPYAAQKGLTTTGMSWHINSEPVKPVPGAFLAILKKDTCTADVVMIGNISDQQSHLTAKRDNVYTDYAFTVQRTLKGTPAKQIVLTRVGGKVDNLPTGGPLISITIENDQYPSLKLDTTYLVCICLPREIIA